jgi:hypothetical protein
MKRLLTSILFLSLFVFTSCSENVQAPPANSPDELAKIRVSDTSETAEPKLDIDPNINLLPEVYSVIHDGIGNAINDTDRLQIKTDTYQSTNGGEYKVISSAWKSK